MSFILNTCNLFERHPPQTAARDFYKIILTKTQNNRVWFKKKKIPIHIGLVYMGQSFWKQVNMHTSLSDDTTPWVSLACWAQHWCCFLSSYSPCYLKQSNDIDKLTERCAQKPIEKTLRLSCIPITLWGLDFPRHTDHVSLPFGSYHLLIQDCRT